MYLALVAPLGIALSVWQANLSRDAPASHWIVALVAVSAVVAMILLGRGRQRERARDWAAGSAKTIRAWRALPRPVVLSAVVWSVLIAGVVSWDVVSFAVQSHALPTLSYYVGHVTRYRSGRGLFFALWLGCGSYLVGAWRRERAK